MKKLLLALAGSLGFLFIILKARKALAVPFEPLVSGEGGKFTTSISGQSVGEVIETGLASWYGPGFDGKQTASGEIFDQNAMTAAHRTMKFGTKLLVTDTDTGNSVVVRVNDRGPFADKAHRIIDLSKGAAAQLGVIQKGTASITLRKII